MSAMGPWLRMVVRNARRTRLRYVDELRFAAELARPDATSDHVLENHPMCDWNGDAIEKLSPPLCMVMLLCHFSSTRSYQQIALARALPCGHCPEPPQSGMHETRRVPARDSGLSAR
jgi:hypothetical protein